MKRKVSVIIPVYNCSRYLSRAVDSVINQSDFFENEIILVDDGSTDGSGDICDKYASEYDNITVVHQKNSGVSVARNNGILKAEGEWVFFLDSDDYVLDNGFSVMLNQGEADIICANYDSNVSDLSNFESTFSPGIHRVCDVREKLNWILASSNQFFYSCWSKLFRLSIIKENGIEFPAGRKYAEDMVFVFTYLLHCETLSLVSEKAYFYYVNEGNATSVVVDSFDVVNFIFVWKSEYFKGIDCNKDQVGSWLTSSYLYKAFCSIKTAAVHMKAWESIRYISEILNTDMFYSLYVSSNEYKTFKTKTDALLDKFIRKKKPIMIFLIFRINELKIKLLSAR